MSLTRDGVVHLVLCGALTLVASITSNNLLFLLVAPMWSLWVVQWPLARMNLRGLAVRRMVPAEIYARHDAGGAWLLINRGRWAARAVTVTEADGVAVPGEVDLLGPRSSQRVATVWRWERRGPARLGAVVLSSTWPFGLVAHEVRLALPAAVLVYPRPLPGAVEPRVRGQHGAMEVEQPGGVGDFLGLRPWRETDSPGRVSWAATARVGVPMVVERATEHERVVEVRLRPTRGEAWEREVSRACGEVHRALERGDAVGLVVPADARLPGVALRPATGRTWRRHLLDALAMLPERP